MKIQQFLMVMLSLLLLSNGFVACNTEDGFSGHDVTKPFFDTFNGTYYDNQSNSQMTLGTFENRDFAFIEQQFVDVAGTQVFCTFRYEGDISFVQQRTYEERRSRWFVANYRMNVVVHRAVLIDGTRNQGSYVRTCSDLAYQEEVRGAYNKDYLFELIDEPGYTQGTTTSPVLGWGYFNPMNFRLHMKGGETWDGSGNRPMEASDEIFSRY
jgi:hypothetical protein